MNSKATLYNELVHQLAELVDLGNIEQLLHYDMRTYMPRNGARDRAGQLETLSSVIHRGWTSDELGKLIEDLSSEYLDSTFHPQNPDDDKACLVRIARRMFDKRRRVPAEFMAEFSRITAEANQIWEEAKATSNFSFFLPYLERIIDFRRQFAQFFAPYDHIYDVLLDDFEPGMKTAEVQSIFGELRTSQVELIRAILEKPPVEHSFLFGNFPEAKQWDCGMEVLKLFGFNPNRSRQDRSVHPFTSGMGLDDVRFTTRIDPNYFGSALFASMHEAGHAFYQLGFNPEYRRSPLAEGASLGMHESQSRLWENLVGRSFAFWKFFYPTFQRYFPEQVGDVSLEQFYKGINRVIPSFIRVEADEATYNLHIMLRLELEISLMEGSLEARDLPAAWNSRMQEYLGLTPPDDARGVLQDVHWSSGLIGYFPTYALGNLISVQIWDSIQRDIPNLTDQIEQGKFSDLLEWLRVNVHQYGAKYEPQVLVQKITGSAIDPKPYLRYLKIKFGEIYQL